MSLSSIAQVATRRARWALALLVLSAAACGSLGVRPTPSATTAATQSSPTITATASTTPRPSTSPMARTLAGVRLEMRPRDVIAVLGDPPRRDVAAGSGLPMWIYGPIGLEWGAQGNDAPLYSILVVPPFAGRTAEGLGLGDDRDAVRRLYGAYQIITQSASSMLVIDDVGTSILAHLDTGGRITDIELFAGDPRR